MLIQTWNVLEEGGSKIGTFYLKHQSYRHADSKVRVLWQWEWAQNFIRDTPDLNQILKYSGSSREYFAWLDTALDQGGGYLNSVSYCLC